MKRKTVFVFGAGSTAALKMPVSEQQKEILKEAAETDERINTLYQIVEKRFKNRDYSINDVYNLIDTALLLQTGLSVDRYEIGYIDLLQAKQNFISFLFNKFTSIIETTDKEIYQKYIDFYYELAQAELNDKLHCEINTDEREFFVSNYAIINFNWDLYSIFPIIEANDKLNRENDRYLPRRRLPQLRMYTDFNYECASNSDDNKPWYPFTEPAAYIANSDKYDAARRVVLTKAYFPHGLMNSFKCPKCARHSLFLDNLHLKDLYGKLDYDSAKELYKCVNCSSKITAKDFNVLVQSNFKTRNAFLEETRIKMFCELESAERLVFIGYSLPEDDTDYRTFFKSLCSVKEVYIVLKDDISSNGFRKVSGNEDLVGYSENTQNTIKRYLAAFNEVYVNTDGFPNAANAIFKIAK